MDITPSFLEGAHLLSHSTVTKEDQKAIEDLRRTFSTDTLLENLHSGCLTLMDTLNTAQKHAEESLCSTCQDLLSVIDHFLASPIYRKERTLLWSIRKEEQEAFVEALMELLLALRHLEPRLLEAESISIRAEAELPAALRHLARLCLASELPFSGDNAPLRALPTRIKALRDDRSATDHLLNTLLPSFYARIKDELRFPEESDSIDLPTTTAIQRITGVVRELRTQIYSLYTTKRPDR